MDKNYNLHLINSEQWHLKLNKSNTDGLNTIELPAIFNFYKSRLHDPSQIN